MLFSANGYQLVVMPMLTAESQSKGKSEAEAESTVTEPEQEATEPVAEVVEPEPVASHGFLKNLAYPKILSFAQFL